MKLVFFFSGLTWFPKFLYQKMHGIHGSSCFSGSWLLMMTWNKFIPKKGGVADGRVRRPEFEFDAFWREKIIGILSLTSWIFVKVNMKVQRKSMEIWILRLELCWQVFFYLCFFLPGFFFSPFHVELFCFRFPSRIVVFFFPSLSWSRFSFTPWC